MNLCAGSWCKWGEKLLRYLYQSWEERKGGQARSEDWISHGWSWCGSSWDGTTHCLSPHRCMVTLAEAKLLGVKQLPFAALSHCFFLLISHLLMPIPSLYKGLARAQGCIQVCWCHPKPREVVTREAGTPCSAQPQHTLRGRNPPADIPLFIQAINNSHKNPLPSLFVLSQTLPMGKETASILWAAGSRLCIFLAHVIPQVPLFLFFFNSLLIHIPPSQV